MMSAPKGSRRVTSFKAVMLNDKVSGVELYRWSMIRETIFKVFSKFSKDATCPKWGSEFDFAGLCYSHTRSALDMQREFEFGADNKASLLKRFLRFFDYFYLKRGDSGENNASNHDGGNSYSLRNSNRKSGIPSFEIVERISNRRASRTYTY